MLCGNVTPSCRICNSTEKNNREFVIPTAEKKRCYRIAEILQKNHPFSSGCLRDSFGMNTYKNKHKKNESAVISCNSRLVFSLAFLFLRLWFGKFFARLTDKM